MSDSSEEEYVMTGLPLIIAFIAAVVLMIIAISKFKIHPFISIMGISLIPQKSGMERMPGLYI